MGVGYHVCFRSRCESVLAPTVGARRAFAAVMKRAGKDRGLYGFGLSGRHGHGVLHGADAPVSTFLRAASASLARVLGLEIEGRVLKQIHNGWHAEDLVAYMHGQDLHHGTGVDPLREATSLPDLFGLRPDGLWLAERLREVAPSITRSQLLRQWGLDDLGEREGLEHLADAAAAAIGSSDLAGRTAPVVAVRAAAVAAAGSGASNEQLAAELGVAERTVLRLRTTGTEPALVRAVRRQLDLRARVPVRALPYDEDPTRPKRRR